MASKLLNSIDVAEELARKCELSLEQVKLLLTTQAAMAYEHANDGYLIPGIGTLVVSTRPERSMVMQFGPRQGKEINVPASKKLKFNISRLAKNMVLAPSTPFPDLFKPSSLGDLKFSTELAQQLNLDEFIPEMGIRIVANSTISDLSVHRMPDFWLSSERIIASDLLCGGGPHLARKFVPGRYPLSLVVAKTTNDARVAFAVLRFSQATVASWEPALIDGKQNSFQYGVDSGTGSFCDASVVDLISESEKDEIGFSHVVTDELTKTYTDTWSYANVESPHGSIAVFSSGYGDGAYCSYFANDAKGNAVLLVTDFGVVDWERPPVPL